MFNGIIESIGIIQNIDTHEESSRISIDFDKNKFNDLNEGDSISVNGICLTLEKISNNQLIFYTSKETNSRTSPFEIKQKVNLERSLVLGDRISGHFVFGHVDGIAKLKNITNIDDSQIWELEIPKELSQYFVSKGSIAINGVSLTINSITANTLFVNLIPFTLEFTNFQYNKIGDSLNIEVDMLARYVESTTMKIDNE